MTCAGASAPADSRPCVERSWPPAPLSVGRARRLLAHHLVGWDLPHLVDPAGLVVSELVTNALKYGRGGHVIRTRFERMDRGVRIEVHDAGADKPERRVVGVDAESGRGLDLVDMITGGRWGVDARNGIGKSVWAVCADDGVAEVAE